MSGGALERRYSLVSLPEEIEFESRTCPRRTKPVKDILA